MVNWVTNLIGRIIETLRAIVAPLVPTIDLETGICRFEINYWKSRWRMITAGRYHDVDKDCMAMRCFPVSGVGRVRVEGKLFHFNRNLKSDEVEREFDKAGYRSANIAELLAFGATFPNVQRDFPVIGLGSTSWISGDDVVPCLDVDRGRRTFGERWWSHNWNARVRFLAVRKAA